MLSLRLYSVLSVLATIACVLHAMQLRKQFYPVVVHLGTSKLSVTIMGNMVFVTALMLAQMMRQIFLGSLRAAELDRLYEKIWFAVTETCLALTIFREELRFRFVFLFTVLLFVKVFHWLSAFRVEQFHTELAVSSLTHVRIVLLMGILLITDVFFFVWQAKTLLLEGPSFLLLFAFEYVILSSTIVTTFLKYLLYLIDMRRNGRWTNKAVYTFYLNLLSDLFQLFVYLIFFSIVLSFYGIPLHIVRDLYNTFGNFKKRIADFIRYRRVIVHMNTRFPTATAEELANIDNTCIICREEMQFPHAKKLPCGHIFHFDCLRSWLEENTTCPTCRNPVEVDTPHTHAHAHQHPHPAPAAAAAPAPAPVQAPAPAPAPAPNLAAPTLHEMRAAPHTHAHAHQHAPPAAAAATAAAAAAAAKKKSDDDAAAASRRNDHTCPATPDTAESARLAAQKAAAESAAAAAKVAAEAHLRAMGLSMDLLNPALLGAPPAAALVDTPTPTPLMQEPTAAVPVATPNMLLGVPARVGVSGSLLSSMSASPAVAAPVAAGSLDVLGSIGGMADAQRLACAPAASLYFGAPPSVLVQQQQQQQQMQHQHQLQLLQQQMMQLQQQLQQQQQQVPQPLWQSSQEFRQMYSTPPVQHHHQQHPQQLLQPSLPASYSGRVLSATPRDSDSMSVRSFSVGSTQLIPELAQLEPVRKAEEPPKMLEEQIEATTAQLEELLAGSSSFDTQGQIYEIKSRIEHLLVPMAHSHSVYVSNLIRNYEVSAGHRSAGAETAPIKKLKLQQVLRTIENQERELSDIIHLCNNNLHDYDPTAPIDETTGLRRRATGGGGAGRQV